MNRNRVTVKLVMYHEKLSTTVASSTPTSDNPRKTCSILCTLAANHTARFNQNENQGVETKLIQKAHMIRRTLSNDSRSAQRHNRNQDEKLTNNQKSTTLQVYRRVSEEQQGK